MAGRKNGKPQKKYYKACFFTEQFGHSRLTKEIETSCFVYTFAPEIKNMDSYLTEYEKNSDLYVFVDKYGNTVPNKLVLTKHTIENQRHNQNTFCCRCKETAFSCFPTCEARSFVAKEYALQIHIQDQAESKKYGDKFFCPACQKSFFADANRFVSSVKSLQDIRLLSRPAELTIVRERAKCPTCGTLAGERQIVGFQAYCDGTMSCRLAEGVLFAQLSGIKREYISEAFGITKSQIDRIKMRMIEQSKKLKKQRAKDWISSRIDIPVTKREFKDSRTGHVYVCYFQDTNHRTDLILLLTQADRDALSHLDSNIKEFQRHFPDEASFYIACFCCLAGERKLCGLELSKKLSELEMLYQKSFAKETTETANSSITQYQSYPLSDKESEKEGKALLRLLWRTPDYPGDYQTDENGQLSFIPLSEKAAFDSGDGSGINGEIDEFISLLCDVLRKNKTSATTVKDTLLHFNPAVITEVEMALQTGKRIDDLDMYAFQMEGLHMAYPPFGAPLPCLKHFLQNGLFGPNNDKLMTCALTEKVKDSEGGDPILPCGLSCDSCPHVQNR